MDPEKQSYSKDLSQDNSVQSQFQAFQKWQAAQLLNQTKPVNETKPQVFQSDQSSIEATLGVIMKQIAEMKAQIQMQIPKIRSSSQSDWRN